MKQFTSFSRSNSKLNNAFVHTEEEDNIVNELFEHVNSKKRAVQILIERGWSKSAIKQKIRYEDNREMRDQHLNNIIQQLKAEKA